MQIDGSDAHHITRVLRLQPGDEIECIAVNGLVHLVEISEVGATVRGGTVKKTVAAAGESPLPIALFRV